MTRFQRSMKEGETKYHYKRSGNHRPNWRQRYLIDVSFILTIAVLFHEISESAGADDRESYANFVLFFNIFYLISSRLLFRVLTPLLLCLKESDEDLPGHVESSMQDPLLLHGSFWSISGLFAQSRVYLSFNIRVVGHYWTHMAVFQSSLTNFLFFSLVHTLHESIRIPFRKSPDCWRISSGTWI